MTTGYLGRITNFRPLFFYKIKNNVFKIVPDNTSGSEPCLIDTGFDGYLILPLHQKTNLKKAFLRKTNFYLANGADIDVEIATYLFHYHSVSEDVFVAFADIPEAVMGMRLLAWFEKVTFDSVNSDVLYKKR